MGQAEAPHRHWAQHLRRLLPHTRATSLELLASVWGGKWFLHLDHTACKSATGSSTHTAKLSSKKQGQSRAHSGSQCVEEHAEVWLCLTLRSNVFKKKLSLHVTGSIQGLTYFESQPLWISTSREPWTGSQKRGQKATVASNRGHSCSLYKSGALINV